MLDDPTRAQPKPEPPADRRKRLTRARDARYRRRVRSGRIVVPVELDGRALDWLVQIRWITPQQADQGDARAIGGGISAGIATSAKG